MAEKTEFIGQGVDPYAPPYKKKKRIPFKWIAFSVVGIVATLCCFGTILVVNVTRAQASSPTQTPTEFGAGTVFDPSVNFYTATPVATETPAATSTGTLITAFGLLTQFAGSATPTATPTPSLSPTPCTGDHFLTQLVCDDLALTATLAAAQPGEVINVSGVDPRVTVIYPTPYPPTATPYIITATPTATDRVVIQTVIVERVITTTPLPTQTPWFYITQPAIVTVMWTQLVTVVVTATETASPIPSETPTATATATETPTP